MKRSALYEQVWSTPMIRLAAELGITDVGLTKACRRHAIPVPPGGHWAKLQAGKASEHHRCRRLSWRCKSTSREPIPRNALVTRRLPSSRIATNKPGRLCRIHSLTYGLSTFFGGHNRSNTGLCA